MAVVKSKRAKNEIFKDDFDDVFFDGFFVENLKYGSRIIIKAKKGYSIVYNQKGDDLIIKAKKVKTKNKIIDKGSIHIPSAIVALPFYVSSSIFVKQTKQEPESYDERLFFTGVKLFANKNYDMAIPFFNEIIKKYPLSKFYVSSYFILGDCYKAKKEYNKAINVYNKAIKLSPKNSVVAQTMFSIADIYISKGYFSRARDIYKSIIKDYNTTSFGDKARFLLAKTFYDQGIFKKANYLFVEANKNSKYYAESFLLAAECFIKQKDDARAVLAYYSMSRQLYKIDVSIYYKELIDVAKALCRFNDYNAAEDLFEYISKSDNQEIIEQSYVGRMECDILKGDFDDLKKKAEYIIHNSKNKQRVKYVEMLLDKAKLQSGNVDKNTIETILKKYKNKPDIASLALYIYAKKSYRDKEYKKAIEYVLRLKKLYPISKYNKNAKKITKDSLNKLIDKFYNNPDENKLDFIYNSVIKLNAYNADMCRIAIGLIVFSKMDALSKILPYTKNQNCKKVLYAKYYIESGMDKNAFEYLNEVDRVVPYIYYVNMVMGDINYFKGRYTSSVAFYKKALNIDVLMLKDYIKIKLSEALMNSGDYKESIHYLGNIKLKLFTDKVLYIKAMDYYNMKKYQQCIDVFKQLKDSSLSYKEKSLFYIAISYIKLKNNDKAKLYYKKLYRQYPKSRYLKTLKAILQ